MRFFAPLRDRFGVQCCLEFYKPEELQFIITRAAEILGVKIDSEGAFWKLLNAVVVHRVLQIVC